MTTTMTMTPEGALEFFERLNILPGTRLLDVACGVAIDGATRALAEYIEVVGTRA